jgi:hypothetical protein
VVCIEEKQCEERSRLLRAEWQRDTVLDDVDRAKDPKLHLRSARNVARVT